MYFAGTCPCTSCTLCVGSTPQCTPTVGVCYEMDSVKLGDIATTGIIYVVIGTSKGAYHAD